MVNRYGGPEVLTYQEAPDPTPGPDEVLIRTEVASVNFADLKARRGTDSVTTPLPLIPGHEVVGTVEAVGAQVHTLCVGQRVTAVVTSGAYAELVVVLLRSLPFCCLITGLPRAASAFVQAGHA